MAHTIKLKRGAIASLPTLVTGEPAFTTDTKNLYIGSDIGNIKFAACEESFTTVYKSKLDGIATGAEVNQNAFTTIKVGETNVVADAKTDIVEFIAGVGISLSANATNDTITIEATGTEFAYPSTGLVVSTGTAWGTSKAAPTGVIVGTTDIQTLSGKAFSGATNFPSSTVIDSSGHIGVGKTPTTEVDVSGTVTATSFSGSGSGLTGLTATQVGLGNVTNDSQVKRSEMNAVNGVATLDSNTRLVQNVVWAKVLNTPTTLAGYGITDAVTTSSNVMPLENAEISSTTLTTATTASNQVVDSISATMYRAVKYTVQVSSGTSYQVTELLVLHDGTTTYLTEYATVMTGTNLATFDADINSGNIRLLVTPANASSEVKVVSTAIAA